MLTLKVNDLSDKYAKQTIEVANQFPDGGSALSIHR